jgi:hypothetical protein
MSGPGGTASGRGEVRSNPDRRGTRRPGRRESGPTKPAQYPRPRARRWSRVAWAAALGTTPVRWATRRSGVAGHTRPAGRRGLAPRHRCPSAALAPSAGHWPHDPGGRSEQGGESPRHRVVHQPRSPRPGRDGPRVRPKTPLNASGPDVDRSPTLPARTAARVDAMDAARPDAAGTLPPAEHAHCLALPASRRTSPEPLRPRSDCRPPTLSPSGSALDS